MKKPTKPRSVSVTLQAETTGIRKGHEISEQIAKPNPLAEVDALEIAKIAATIPTQGITIRDRVKQAYSLLHYAQCYKALATRKNMSPLRLMSLQDQGWDLEEYDEEDYLENPAYKELKAFEKIGTDGVVLPMPFAEGLQKLMPRVKKTDIRTDRFIQFLMSDDAFGQNWTREIVEKKVGEFKQSGIPWGQFEDFYVKFSFWWPDYYSRTQSEKRKGKTKGKAEPKGKQGRVIRKNDKRKGSRAGSFLKALKKTS
jgi:hypothetical protein